MKYSLRVKNQVFSGIFILACIVGCYFACKTAEKHAIIIRGVLGLVVIFFIWLEFLGTNNIVKEDPEIELEIPKDLRYFLYGFVLTTIFFWSIIEIGNMIRFIFKF